MTFRVSWTKAQDDQLRALWGSGLSASKIGAEMGMSKNMVIGRAYRLALPSRPSPIGNRPAVPRNNARVHARVAANTERAAALALLGYSTHAVAVELDVNLDTARKYLRVAGMNRRTNGQRPGASAPGQASQPAPAVTFRPRKAGTCCWPMWGSNERPTHRYCADATTTRKDGTPSIYCAAHHARAFVSAMHALTAPRRAA